MPAIKKEAIVKQYWTARQNLEQLIRNVPDFIGQWETIEETYKRLNFVPYTDNQKKVDDFKFINRKFTQYVFNKQKDLLAHLDEPQTLSNLVNKYSQTEFQVKKEGWSVRNVVYFVIRNAWLANINRQVSIIFNTSKAIDQIRTEE